MTERSNSTTEAVGEVPQANEILLVDGGRRFAWAAAMAGGYSAATSVVGGATARCLCSALSRPGAAAARRRAMGHPQTAAGQAVAADNMAGQQQLPQNNPWLGRRAAGWIVAVQFAARGIHQLGATTEGADGP